VLVASIGMGIVISFLFSEFLRISPGGIIVPGYIALFLDQPQRVATTFIVALAVLLVIKLLGRFVIIYSRRRFMLTVLLGYLLGWLATQQLLPSLRIGLEFQIIGFIVPGLIANDMFKQGIWKTVVASLAAALVVRLLLLIAF